MGRVEPLALNGLVQVGLFSVSPDILCRWSAKVGTELCFYAVDVGIFGMACRAMVRAS